MRPGGTDPERTPLSELVAVGVAMLAIALYWTWPLAALGRDHFIARNPGLLHADLYLITWILAWGTHALTTDPSRLFDGNIMHPAPSIVAHSEHLLADQPIFAPLWLVTGNPVLSLNVLTLATFPLCGLAMYVLVRAWTASRVAAAAAAIAFAFAPWRIGLGRPHLLHVHYLPLIVLWGERAVRTGRSRPAVAAGLALAAQTLASYYLGYVAVLAAATVLLFAQGERLLARRGVAWSALLLIVLVSAAIVIPPSLPYLEGSSSGRLALAREIEPHFEFLAGLRPLRIFVLDSGPITLGLAAVGALAVLGRRRTPGRTTRVLILLTMVASAISISGGPFGPLLYRVLAALLPGFEQLRALTRFLVLATFAASVLSGFAVAAVMAPRAGWTRRLATAAIFGALAWQLARAPDLVARPVEVGDAIPPVYRWLARHGDGRPLLEVPVGLQLGVARDRWAGRAVYMSTYHWLPVLNGHTGYSPPHYLLIEAYAEQLPSPQALRVLVACTGLRWILVHGDPARCGRWDAVPAVRERMVFAGRGTPADTLYEVDVDSPGSCPLDMTRVPQADPGPRTALRGQVTATVSPPSERRHRTGLRVTLVNTGEERWAGPTIDPAERTSLVVHWTSLGPGRPKRRQHRVPLPVDVAPGRPLTFDLWTKGPNAPGAYRIDLWVARDGQPPADGPSWSGSVRVP